MSLVFERLFKAGGQTTNRASFRVSFWANSGYTFLSPTPKPATFHTDQLTFVYLWNGQIEHWHYDFLTTSETISIYGADDRDVVWNICVVPPLRQRPLLACTSL